ncbi:MAG TPA: ATP-binding protein, partial [Ktedonobacterales bacterium]|nr:ATP-binding protein [Ktedonobacterales bacterium]
MMKSKRLIHQLGGYSAAVLGVALTTLCIGLVRAVAHVENLSMAYLLVVLWLAVFFGRGPAILASLLAFLFYDFFFVPPTGTFLTEDPVQWISLFALLMTALVIGHLTAVVQSHAAASLASQRRTERLYTLAQLIAAPSEQHTLLQVLAQQVVQTFAADGVSACALVLPDGNARLQLQAMAPSTGRAIETLRVAGAAQGSLAEWVLQHGIAARLPERIEGQRDQQTDETLFYVPLSSGNSVMGVLGIAGVSAVRCLVPHLFASTERHPSQAQAASSSGPEAAFFAAFCGHMALALEQIALRQEAIHAEALRESDRLKNALLGSVTHDLRTPLASIKAATSSLLEPGMIWQEHQPRELIATIDASIDRLSHLVRNLLDLSRLEAGVAELEYDWHDIGDLIASVLEQLELAGQLGQRQIVVTLPETMPLALLDHGQIERVLINLLENALKYSPPDSDIEVQARAKENPPELEVRISDQGIGIATQELEAIFEKFYRVQPVRLPWTSTPPALGTGLGLAICRNIIRAHHGRIWAESTPGSGSAFSFVVPIPPDGPEGALPEL